ncbi:hypothetical protein T492DRAFT_29498 [Pavlovales sp. CCMP2436]|nr:hypothetical protein T492DRAFT_29498 [Pavlovales sp. CCMP2436]
MSRGGAPKGLLRELWDGPGKWLVPVLAGWAFGVGIMVPVITDITEDYFASAYPLLLVRGGSRAVHNGICPEHPAPENAERCAGAIAASVGVASYADAVGSLITFLLSAGLGRLSDELGRRPFVLASFCIPQIAHLALAFYYSSTVRGLSDKDPECKKSKTYGNMGI